MMIRHSIVLLLFVVSAGALSPPTFLQLNYMTDPLGVDRVPLHFAWQLAPSRDVNDSQVSARVVVNMHQGTDAPVLVYDSGVVATTQPELISSSDVALKSDVLCTWTVQVWTASDEATSSVANFTTGLFHDDWSAEWIRGGSQMRKDFVVMGPVARASIFISACQYYTLYIDGQIVGDYALDGPWTNFYTNRSYTTYSVNPAVFSPGKHTLGIRVGQGFCTSASHDMYDSSAERSAILQLQLHSSQPPGSQQIQRIVTDSTWSVSDGPIRSDSTYYGETYDATFEQPGWSTSTFVPPSGRKWTNATTNFGVVALLHSQAMPPMKRVRLIKPISMTKVPQQVPSVNCDVSSEGGGGANVTCPNSVIENITFVSFGTVQGDCISGLSDGSCTTSSNLTNFVAEKCIGQSTCIVSCVGQSAPPQQPSCRIVTSSGTSLFREGEPCLGTSKLVGLSVKCKVPPPPMPNKTKFVYDFGQEFAGVVRLSLPSNVPRGLKLTLKHAECLSHPPLAPRDGSVYMGNLFWANPVDVYVAKGGNEPEIYEPTMTYHGFRYLEIDVSNGDLPEDLNMSSVLGVNLRSSVAESAELKFGSDATAPTNIIQRLSNNSWWTEAAALMSIPAGAAGRGERNGWTGDAAFGSESESFDFDTAAFFSRYLEQLIDQQSSNGEIGGGCPNQGTSKSTLHPLVQPPFDPSWSAVIPLVAYNVWKYHNCTTCIDNAWSGLTLYMEMLENSYQVTPWTFGKWGDWNPAYPEPRTPDGKGPPFTMTSSHITAATMVVQNHIEMAELARVTGRIAAAERLEALIPSLKKQYHESFFDSAGNYYGEGTLTAFGAALWLGVTPVELLPVVVENFVNRIVSYQYRMVGVGFIGVRYIFEALAKVNRTDVAIKMLQVTDYPSFGYQITNEMEPATSLWESYDAPTMHQWVDESSRDHHYSASINTFLRKYLGGLDQPSGSNAWKVVKCRPAAAHWPNLLSTASATVASRRGSVGCAWESSAVAPRPLPPPTPPASNPARYCAITPQFTGALRKPTPMILQCPDGSTINKIKYAKWGKEQNFSEGGWYCYGPQPPPVGACESDQIEYVEPLCLGKQLCNLSSIANVQSLGNPCAPPPPPTPPATLTCPKGQHVDWIQAEGDNGSCKCSQYCSSNWGNAVKSQRPQWVGAASMDNESTTACRCVQGSHFCTDTSNGCGASCKDSVPFPTNYCTPGSAPPAPPPPTDPSLALIVRVSCTSGGSGGKKHDRIVDQPFAERGRIGVNVAVPAGSTGEVHFPVWSLSSGTIYESAVVVWKAGVFSPAGTSKGVTPRGTDGLFVVFETASGHFNFTSMA